MTDETKGGGAPSATGLPAAEQLESLRTEVGGVTEPAAADESESFSDTAQEAEEGKGPEQTLDLDDALETDPVPETEAAGAQAPDSTGAGAARSEELARYRLERSCEAIVNCREIYAVARTALEEMSQLSTPYLTFEQKTRVYAEAANFGRVSQSAQQTPRPSAAMASAASGGPNQVVVEEIERMVLARVQERLGRELSPLVQRAGSVALEAGPGSDIGGKLESLANALRSLERSLPERIGEVVDSRLSDGGFSNGQATGLLAAVEEVRSAATGFSIEDLDLGAIASLTDRAGTNALPSLNAEATLPYLPPSDLVVLTPAEPVVQAPDSDSDPGVHLRALSTDDSDQAVPQKAVVFLERSADEAGLESLELDPFESTADRRSGPLPSQAPDHEFEPTPEGAAESNEPAGADETPVPEEPFVADEPQLAVAEEEELTILATPPSGEVADEEDVVADLSSTTGVPEEEFATEDVVLAPVVSDEDSIELDLGAPTGEIEPPTSVSLSIDDDEEQEATIVARPPPEAEAVPDAGDQAASGPILHGTEIELRLQHAADLRSRNRLTEALQQYDEVLEHSGPNYEAHIGRGVVYLQTRNYERAASEFSVAEQLDSGRPAGALGLAEVSFHQKQFAEAIKHYSSCIRLDPRLAQAFRNRGLCYYHQQNFSGAEHDLRKAYELDPGLPNIKKYLRITRNKLRSLGVSAPTEASP